MGHCVVDASPVPPQNEPASQVAQALANEAGWYDPDEQLVQETTREAAY